MTKMKQKLISVLTLSMMLSSMSANVFAAPIPSTDEGTYTIDAVVAKQYYTPETNSMCNGVFAAEGEVIISGDTATIKIYVANPTPAWDGKEDGILKDFVLNYDGQEYPGVTTIIGFENDNAPVKTFGQESSFFGIEEGDKLACDEIVISDVPVAALQDDMIHLSAFVNLVMNSTQDFYMDFSYASSGSSDGSNSGDQTGGAGTQTHSVTVSATVVNSEYEGTDYIITIPSTIDVGSLSSSEDNTHNYTVGVTEMGDMASVTVSSEASGTLTDGTNTIAYTNTFNDKEFTATGSQMGAITVKASDVTSATEGDYTGTLEFVVTAK